MSFRTCSWLFPQKEQRYGTFAPLLPPVVLNRSPCLSCAGLTSAFARSGLRLLLSRRARRRLRRFRRLRDAGALAAGQSGIMGRSDQRRSLEVVDRIDDAIVLRLFGRHEAVSIRVLDHLFDWLARVASQNLVVQRN